MSCCLCSGWPRVGATVVEVAIGGRLFVAVTVVAVVVEAATT